MINRILYFLTHIFATRYKVEIGFKDGSKLKHMFTKFEVKEYSSGELMDIEYDTPRIIPVKHINTDQINYIAVKATRGFIR